MLSTKKAIVLPLGCPENRIDSARILELFKKNGYTETTTVRLADVVVVNTCALTSVAEKKSINAIKKIRKRMKKGAQLIIGGCLFKLKPHIEGFESEFKFGVDDDLENLNRLFNFNQGIAQCHANYLLPSYCLYGSEMDQAGSNNSRFCAKYKQTELQLSNLRTDLKTYGSLSSIYWLALLHILRQRRFSYHKTTHIYGSDVFSIKVSTGCLFKCSYCSVRLSRGLLKSKPIAEIVDEFREGIAAGFTIFGLLGTEVGSYGKDINESLLGLLENLILAGQDHKFEIRLRNIHPNWLITNLADAQRLLDTGIITYLSIPIQSGSDRILKAMRRGYQVESIKHAVGAIRSHFPQIHLHSQIMVGFPGETDADFDATLSLLQELQLNDIEVYNFTPRRGTVAASMPNRISYKTSLKRAYKICKTFDHALRMG